MCRLTLRVAPAYPRAMALNERVVCVTGTNINAWKWIPAVDAKHYDAESVMLFKGLVERFEGGDGKAVDKLELESAWRSFGDAVRVMRQDKADVEAAKQMLENALPAHLKSQA